METPIKLKSWELPTGHGNENDECSWDNEYKSKSQYKEPDYIAEKSDIMLKDFDTNVPSNGGILYKF